MTYFQGFLIPVPENKKDAYEKMAREAAPIFQDHGAQRIVECWDEDVPRGENTDMYRAVKAEEGENVVFSWMEWASKDAFEKAHASIGEDERMQDPPDEMPFDGMRLTYAGFEALGESGNGGKAGYVQGYFAPVPTGNRDSFSDMCATMREVAIDCGALRAVDSWSEDIEDGKATDFKQAVQTTEDEAVAFGFVEWPSKQAYDKGSAKMREDKRMPPPGSDMPLDATRMIYGGFEVMLDAE